MRVKTDEKRQAILNAAAEVFREQGFAGASMAAVSERIGGSKATIYRYFPSKEALFLTTMLDAAIDRAALVFEGLDPAEDLAGALSRFGCAYLSLALLAETLAVRRILIAEGSRSGIGQRLFEDGPKVTWSMMAAFLSGHMAAGRLRPAEPWTAAMHLRGLLEADPINRALIGAEVSWEPARLAAHVDDAVAVFLRAYAP